MTISQLLLFVLFAGGITCWRKEAIARWVHYKMGWMFIGSFVTGVGLASSFDLFMESDAMANLTSPAVVAFGLVWVAWGCGAISFIGFNSLWRKAHALRTRAVQNPG